MWVTLMVMAIMVSVEPVRIGFTVMMLSRPRPVLQLFAFLCGGFAMGLGVGLVVLFILQRRLITATNLTVPKVQIAIGLLAILIAAVLAMNISARLFQRRPRGGAGAVPTESARARHLPRGTSLWVAAVLGTGIALPSVDYMAALAVILASGAGAATQAGALLLFNVVAFALVEIPLVAYLVAPEKTRALLAALNDWIRSRRRREVAALLAAIGCVMLAVGIAGL